MQSNELACVLAIACKGERKKYFDSCTCVNREILPSNCVTKKKKRINSLTSSMQFVLFVFHTKNRKDVLTSEWLKNAGLWPKLFQYPSSNQERITPFTNLSYLIFQQRGYWGKEANRLLIAWDEISINSTAFSSLQPALAINRVNHQSVFMNT